MRCLGTWFSGGFGSVRFTVGLDDLKGLFQPIRFCDSVKSELLMDGGTKCTFNNIVHGTKLGGAVNTLENGAAIQKDLNRLEKWADGNLMRRRLNRLT
ncbi:hypothetical protein QYF61_024388 [Mycteria americana]|uniref:Rna-directed dna polymerase from mobile element jockey-like n=1 Tax=Mycteria americana TaxID=33587 RepID=A0AAN7PKZ5_MYCAM|nr:hypothetical protein QYF61_024388 [Mycteria americana]